MTNSELKFYHSFLRSLLAIVALFMIGCGALAAGAAGGAAAGSVESAQAAESPQEHSTGTYVATVLSNVVYFPAKVIFAGAGAATTGVAYLVTGGDREVTNNIWNSSVGGTYVVTPDMIEGDESVRFVG
ncbi:MAG: hypothetical protein J5J00_07670 [Deltaproteobacteria bacterium]|nr:hypothetical protein [Deltaproteobacteria bacterium]